MSEQSDTAICPGCGEEMAITTELYGPELVSHGICHKCGRAARKSKRQRDNWKARYVALVAELRDDSWDGFGYSQEEYRARLLAKIDEAKETT